METFNFHYKFKFGDGRKKEFTARLEKETLNLIVPKESSPPEWTRLEHCQCPNCPLDTRKHPHCPVALNLSDLIDSFKDEISTEKVSLSIEAEERTYLKTTSVQKGLSSLMGIYMVTSGCPILDQLKPMARFHLPFATVEETLYRALSMYLLAQYFVYKRGRKPDWDLKNLKKIYNDIRLVNRSFSKRLKSVQPEDALPNAVVILNNFADSLVFSIDKNAISRIERLFKTLI